MLCSPVRLTGGRRRLKRVKENDHMTGAMYAAIGGLKTHMTNLNVIGNNIANVNTAGYKAQRMIFQESIYTTSRSGSNGTITRGGNTPSQIGYGAQVGSIDLNMSPGTFNPTGVALDCMIEGDGFFMVGNKDLIFNSAEDLPKATLTRVGDFNIDANGYVTDGNNNVVYGFAMVENPYYTPGAQYQFDPATGRNIMDRYIMSTQLVPLRVPAAAAAPTPANGGIDDAGNQLWQAGDAVYDLLGAPMATSETPTARQNYSLVNPALYDENGALDPDRLPEGVGQQVGPDGELIGDYTYKGPLPSLSGELVKLEGISINSNGAITGVSQNGETVIIGYAAVAQCTAPDGVTHVGGPYYKAMEGAGAMSVGVAGGLLAEGTYLNNQMVTIDGEDSTAPSIKDLMNQMKSNEIRNGGLEASTADVATEFANMIVTQRGYQANTRIVTVTDSMLEELVNMKR